MIKLVDDNDGNDQTDKFCFNVSFGQTQLDFF